MPEVRDLPENMDKEEFKAQFDSVYSPTYQGLLKKIDTRISSCSVYDFQRQWVEIILAT